MEMVCYKCGSSDELSIKARLRDGSVRAMICKTCRNAAMKLYKENHPVVSKPKPLFDIHDQEEWELRAKESYERIIKNHSGMVV